MRYMRGFVVERFQRCASLEPDDEQLEPFVMSDGVTTLGSVAVLSDPVHGAPLWSGVWICEPKSWSSPFEANEIILVLSGSAEVHLDSGEVVELRPGSSYRFDRGEVGRWEVRESLTTFAVLI